MALQWPAKPPAQLLLIGAGLLGLGALAAVSAMQLARLRPQLLDKQRLIQTLTQQNQQLQQELGSLQTDRQELEGRLNDVRKELLWTSTELGRLRTAVGELQGRYDALAGENTRLDTRLTELMRERDNAQEHVRQLEDERFDLERLAGKLRDRFALLDRDYQRVVERLETLERERAMMSTLAPSAQAAPQTSPQAASAQPSPASASPATAGPQAVELPPIVVRKDQAGLATALQGQVVEINAQHQFVVVDQGTDDGILLGMTLDILRGAARVGRVRVVRVRSQMAACEIIRSETVGPLQVGDLALPRSF